MASRVATQFLIGRDLLAAPVMDRATPRVHVYLPPGDVWLDVWTTQQAPVQPTGPTVSGGLGGGLGGGRVWQILLATSLNASGSYCSPLYTM
jgi:hypothetical protein